ncbi:PREDICTED: basic proline-rich protein-like [Lipotes vexillifer]|uniref:Basic proline-rich protein-like n=1 Tax=Lipotes vexillifer TaxID=118797 RepID=A0A340WSZ2_LIPVE|nr:PREDICTED: basic proline-rich protein-like [Lipotes vexillifer]
MAVRRSLKESPKSPEKPSNYMQNNFTGEDDTSKGSSEAEGVKGPRSSRPPRELRTGTGDHPPPRPPPPAQPHTPPALGRPPPRSPGPARAPRAAPAGQDRTGQGAGASGPAPLHNRPAGRPRCVGGGGGDCWAVCRSAEPATAGVARLLTWRQGRERAGTGAVPAGLGVGPCAARPASRAPAPAPCVRGSLPPARSSPQPQRPSPGTKRLRGGAEPAALAGASGDGRAPSSDSSRQPPIRPRETESPCLASSPALPPDPAHFPVPHALPFPGTPPALRPGAQEGVKTLWGPSSGDGP